MKKFPLVLAILDGWGIGPKNKKTNAVWAARTPFFDEAVKKYPFTTLGASGHDVGLEIDQTSGSETGHLNIGAGRIVPQDVRIILQSIGEGTFFHNPAFLKAVDHAKKYDSNIHLIGMMGQKDSPHSHPDIVLGLLSLLRKFFRDKDEAGAGEKDKKKKVFLHLFTDGRDSYPKSALEHWESIWKKMIEQSGIAKLATVCGRFYGMDRAKNWPRLMKAFDAMVGARGEKFSSFEEVVEANYKKNQTDEYFEPAVLVDENGQRVGQIGENDSLIFFNFRSDRARQFVKLFVNHNFFEKREKNFPHHKVPKNLCVVAMTNFGPDLLGIQTAFFSPPLTGTLPLALKDFHQLYISETEKFAHVTYFINGGYADPIVQEDRIMIHSPEVRSYVEKPEMAAAEIGEVIRDNIKEDVYDFITVNFPNADMLGHTGDFKATVRGIETVDREVKKIARELMEKDGVLLLTADHGNADIMLDEKSQRPFTFHTKNPVPFAVVSNQPKLKKLKLKKGGVLGDIAPTILDILDAKKLDEMNRGSLVSS